MTVRLVPRFLSPDWDPPSRVVAAQLAQLQRIDRSDAKVRAELVESLDTLSEVMIGRRGRRDAELRSCIRAVRDSILHKPADGQGTRPPPPD